MNELASIPQEPIRLVFGLERADNPRLYDDLIRFKKGTKRVNRLRLLAHEGLLAEHLPMRSARQNVGLSDEVAPRDVSTIGQMFEPPLAE